ncbi:pitrilysin family protein [Sphingomonas japonica]
MLSGAALCALAAPAIAQRADPAPVAELVRQVNIPYEEFTLPNGLRVITHTDRKAPIVAVSVWYDVGSKHEPDGRTGFAHLFEHLMFNGSENAPGEFFTPLREIGATDFNGTTSNDRTNYFETVPKAGLERTLFLESDRMGYLLGAVTQGVLDEQRGVVQNEKRQGDNQPYGLTWYSINEGLFPEGHPYRHSVIGSMADLDAASLADVKTFFRSHYGPNNAVLVLAGDIDAAEARPLVEKYFGSIPKGPETIEPRAPVPVLSAPVVETMKDRVATTRIYRVWPVPGLRDPDMAPLDVAASVLGGLSSSRLQNVLVRQERLAVGVNAYNSSLAQAGMFLVSIDVRPGVDPALAAKRLDEVIAELVAKGPTADEVQRVATTAASSRISGLESVGGFGGKAVALASGALYNDDPGQYKKDLAALAAATPEQVRAVTAKWLSRPSYQLTVVPGERDAYVEAQGAPQAVPGATAPATASSEGPAKGTRGAMPPVGEIGSLKFPAVQRATLSNGIELVYAQVSAVPVTQAVLSFDAGIVADPVGKLGTQGLTLSVLDEGTASLDSVEIAETKERFGAGISAGSSADRTYLSLSTPSANLDGSAALLADIVRNPAFAPAEVERLKAQQLARIAAEATEPQAIAQRTLPGLIYGEASPYAKLAAGSGDPEAVAALTRADLVAFQQAWLRPEKAKIFVVSDRPIAEVRGVLDRHFGDWKGEGAPGAKPIAGAGQTVSPRIVLVDRPNSPQSIIVGGELTPLKPRDELLPALTANEVLGGNFLSRINMDLREEKGWSYGAGGGFRRYEGAVPYQVSAPVQADKTGEALASLRRELGEFTSTAGVTPTEFDQTIDGKTNELAGNFETSDAILAAMQQNDLFGRPDDYYATIAQKYRGLTREQLDAAARAAIDPAEFVWVVVGDAKTVRPQLDSIGLPVEVVTATPAPTPAAAVGQ